MTRRNLHCLAGLFICLSCPLTPSFSPSVPSLSLSSKLTHSQFNLPSFFSPPLLSHLKQSLLIDFNGEDYGNTTAAASSHFKVSLLVLSSFWAFCISVSGQTFLTISSLLLYRLKLFFLQLLSSCLLRKQVSNFHVVPALLALAHKHLPSNSYPYFMVTL